MWPQKSKNLNVVNNLSSFFIFTFSLFVFFPFCFFFLFIFSFFQIFSFFLGMANNPNPEKTGPTTPLRRTQGATSKKGQTPTTRRNGERRKDQFPPGERKAHKTKRTGQTQPQQGPTSRSWKEWQTSATRKGGFTPGEPNHKKDGPNRAPRRMEGQPPTVRRKGQTQGRAISHTLEKEGPIPTKERKNNEKQMQRKRKKNTKNEKTRNEKGGALAGGKEKNLKKQETKYEKMKRKEKLRLQHLNIFAAGQVFQCSNLNSCGCLSFNYHYCDLQGRKMNFTNSTTFVGWPVSRPNAKNL